MGGDGEEVVVEGVEDAVSQKRHAVAGHPEPEAGGVNLSAHGAF